MVSDGNGDGDERALCGWLLWCVGVWVVDACTRCPRTRQRRGARRAGYGRRRMEEEMREEKGAR